MAHLSLLHITHIVTNHDLNDSLLLERSAEQVTEITMMAVEEEFGASGHEP